MISFLGSLFSATIGRLPDLARRVFDGVKAIWHALTSLGRGVRRAWSLFVSGVKAIAHGIETVALDTYRFSKWLLVTKLPALTKWLLQHAGAAASAVVNAVKAFATGLYHLALHYAETIVNTLSAWVHDALSFVTSTLSKAWNLLTHVAGIVDALLTDAGKLAEWVFGALWRLFWKQVQAVAMPVARWLFSHLLTVAVDSVDVIESVIADLFGH